MRRRNGCDRDGGRRRGEVEYNKLSSTVVSHRFVSYSLDVSRPADKLKRSSASGAGDVRFRSR